MSFPWWAWPVFVAFTLAFLVLLALLGLPLLFRGNPPY
jgi:hypothetical protein